MSRAEKLSKWTVLWSAFFIGIILGILYAWSVIKLGLKTAGWDDRQATLPYTTFTVCMSIGFCLSGRIYDRIGPRKCVAGCAVLMGIGLILSGLFPTPFMVSLFFGGVCGFGVGAGNSASLAPVQKWFPASKKGMVTGIALAGIATSAVLYSPLTKFLADPVTGVGVANSFIIYGIISFAVMFLLSFNMYDPPVGYDREAGAKPKVGGHAKSPAAAKAASGNLSETDIATKDMLKTPKFYLMFLTFALSTASGLMIIANAAGIAKEQAHWENGFLLAIILNIFNAAGRFLGGSISDKLGRTTTLKLTLILQGINLILFRYYTSVPLLILGIVIQGFCYGTIFSVMPTLTSDLFGLKNFGANYGTLFLAWGIGGIIGPMPAAVVFDSTGEYGAAYIIAFGLTAVSLALACAIRGSRSKRG